MSLDSDAGGEFVDVKVFLYKYTPQFTFTQEQVDKHVVSTTSGKETVEGPYQVTKYSIDLNAPKYFSKFDLTQFIKSYQFKQGLYGNTYDWSVNFQDAVIPFAQLSPSSTSTVRKTVSFRSPTGKFNGVPEIAGPPCRNNNSLTSSFTGVDLVSLMAQYEAESNWPTSFTTEVQTITEAYLRRGTVTIPYASSSQGNSNSILNAPGSDIKFNNPQLDGIRLSDLVQKYNYMSVFVYKSSVSKNKAKQQVFPNGIVKGANGTTQSFDPSNEVHLMLMGYRNEFNGFVTGKNFSRTPGQVDQVVVTGHGSLRLFSDTKTLYDPSLMAGGFYEGSTLNAIAPSFQLDSSTQAVQQYFSIYKNLFQGQDPIEILTSLLFLVYKISFNLTTLLSPSSSSAPQEYRGFYDIYQLVLRQSGSTTSALESSSVTIQNKAGNLITIAPFLLALVMALRNYDYNIQTELQTTTENADLLSDNLLNLGSKASSPKVNGLPDNKFTPIDPNKLLATSFSEEFGGPCVQISAVDKLFTPYFKMLKEGFDNYLSQLKTPNEIMSEVTLASLLEFYEQPNGRIVLRTPQYNQPARFSSTGVTDPTGNMVTSKDVAIIQSTYSEDGTQLQTQKRGSWSTDLVGGVGPFHPSYGNGKLMMQYGFREAITEPNPVLSSLAKANTQGVGRTAAGVSLSAESADINNLVHKYLRFLLEFDNASLRVGSLTLDGAPELEVGKLFFDFINNKMGYIVDVQKQLVVGGTYTASINLKFVRDITSAGTNFRQIPTLEELVSAGTPTLTPGASSTPIIKFPSVPKPKATGALGSQQLFSNLTNGLSTNPFGSGQ